MSITKQDIIKYTTQTPQNTNPAVLNSLLDNFGSSGEVWSPETVTGEGDVSIIYKGNQIGVLSDSGTLTLDVEDTICEDDIEVEYTKPTGGGYNVVPIGIDNTPGADITYSNLTWLYIDDNENLYTFSGFTVISATNVVPAYASGNYKYSINIPAPRDGDIYTVTINGSAVPYDETNGYSYTYNNAAYPESITIAVENKPGR